MAFMVLATGLYINACAKGEECIPQTWDMFHEKQGFMLIFWNYAGVPFVREHDLSCHTLDTNIDSLTIDLLLPDTIHGPPSSGRVQVPYVG